jgi:hypothetical protein
MGVSSARIEEKNMKAMPEEYKQAYSKIVPSQLFPGIYTQGEGDYNEFGKIWRNNYKGHQGGHCRR